MSQLEDFPPTAYEPEVARLNWHAGPCSLTKFSTLSEEDDWFILMDKLTALHANQDWEVVQFDHWSCDYVLEVFTRPGSDAENVCEQFTARKVG